MTSKSMNKYFDENPKALKKIIDRIKLNAKARIEAGKVRNSVIKGETNNFEEHLLENFNPANNTGKSQYRELFIIEGKSARGSSLKGRFDNDTQALFSLRGVPLNSFGLDINKVLLNAEFNSLVKILGCNIGAKFDISKLRYDKIIIMSDSDSDGFNITSLVCAFFLSHMPEIIKAGKLYKAIAPLYRIKSKYKEFILNRSEYISIFEKQIRDSITLQTKNKKDLSHTELKEFLLDTRDYLDILTRTASHLAIDPLLLEFILNNHKAKNFKSLLTKVYPELSIDSSNVISGIHNNTYQILIMDKIFIKRTREMMELIDDLNSKLQKYNNKDSMFYLYETNSNKEKINLGYMSIGEILFYVQRYQPEIITRFKGLGELDPVDLCKTTLDPNNRIMIRLTMDEVERELTEFRVLHGDECEERKLMMKSFVINREELDN
jgi:DNA gyrase subunit B